MHIDLERLKAERDIDPFEFAPIDIEDGVRVGAEIIRDNSLRNLEVMAHRGFGTARVMVESPTPRLRQRLAVLGWVPFEPSSDERWFIDEPVPFPKEANSLVADFTARYYAEGMNLLFAPDDGMFSGGARYCLPAAGAPVRERNALVRTMAERIYVARCIVYRICPGTVLHSALEGDVRRANAARDRGGLEPLLCPSTTTVRRWGKEFAAEHRDRPGLGDGWRNYECPTAGTARVA